MTQLLSELPYKIPAPALRALHAAGYLTLDEITKTTQAELLQLHGMGPKAVRIINEALVGSGCPPLQ